MGEKLIPHAADEGLGSPRIAGPEEISEEGCEESDPAGAEGDEERVLPQSRNSAEAFYEAVHGSRQRRRLVPDHGIDHEGYDPRIDHIEQ